MWLSGRMQSRSLGWSLAEGVGGRGRVRGQIAVAEHHAARAAGRAGGVENRGEGLGAGGWGLGGRRCGLAQRWFVAAIALLVVDEENRASGNAVRKLRQQVLARNEHQPCAAIGDLRGDLLAGERDVDRHVDGAGQVQRQVGDDPLVAVLGNVGDAVAGLDAGRLNRRGECGRVVGHLLPSAPVQLAVPDEAEGPLVAAARDGVGEKRGNRRRFHQLDPCRHIRRSVSTKQLVIMSHAKARGAKDD